jgi:hypothetical protein
MAARVVPRDQQRQLKRVDQLSCGSSRAAASAATTLRRWRARLKIEWGRPAEVDVPPPAPETGVTSVEHEVGPRLYRTPMSAVKGSAIGWLHRPHTLSDEDSCGTEKETRMSDRWLPVVAAILGVLGVVAGAAVGGYVANKGQ